MTKIIRHNRLFISDALVAWAWQVWSEVRGDEPHMLLSAWTTLRPSLCRKACERAARRGIGCADDGEITLATRAHVDASPDIGEWIQRRLAE